MCLFKVYVREGNAGQTLVAREVALVNTVSRNVQLVNLDFEETLVEDVEVLSIDALNSVLLLHKREV